MTEAEFLGMLVVCLVTLTGLFFSIHKPLTENTKAMTTLSVKVEQLAEKIEKSELNFEEYKEHVSDGQRRQWDEIDRHSEILAKHDISIETIKEQMQEVK